MVKEAHNINWSDDEYCDKRKEYFKYFNKFNVIGDRLGLAREPFSRLIPRRTILSRGMSDTGMKPSSMFCKRIDDKYVEIVE